MKKTWIPFSFWYIQLFSNTNFYVKVKFKNKLKCESKFLLESDLTPLYIKKFMKSNVNYTINQCKIWMTFQQMSSMKSLHLKSKLYICTFEGAIIILKQCKRRNRNKFPRYYVLYVLRTVCNRFSHPKNYWWFKTIFYKNLYFQYQR